MFCITEILDRLLDRLCLMSPRFVGYEIEWPVLERRRKFSEERLIECAPHIARKKSDP